MPHTFPDARFERVRDHLERAIAILHRDEAAQGLRDMIEEAVDLALECAYRPSSSHLRSISVLNAANDDGAGRNHA